MRAATAAGSSCAWTTPTGRAAGPSSRWRSSATSAGWASAGNLGKLDDVALWKQVVAGPITPVIEDASFLAEAADKLPAEPWDETTWKGWTSGLAGSLGRKGRALFHPLRLARTAQESGPEMARLLLLIGRARAEARLKGQAA
jgi:glutamyl-tRNA synthetase